MSGPTYRDLGGGWTRTTFEVVKYRQVKNLPCPVCGKRIRRIKTFTATVNPWNVNEAGEQRTYAEVHERLVAKAMLWAAMDQETHPACAALRHKDGAS